MKQSGSVRARLAAGVVTAALVALLGGLLLSPASTIGDALSRASYDLLHRLAGPKQLKDSPVVVIYLDPESHEALRQEQAAPWPRALHAKLLDRLTAAGARAVVFDIVFGGPSTDPSADRALAAAISANGKVVLAAELAASSHDTRTATAWAKLLELNLPEQSFLRAASAWGAAVLQVDADFTSRQFFPGYLSSDRPSLVTATAKVLGISNQPPESAWTRYYGGPGTVPSVSYHTVLEGGVTNSFFRNRIVFIGARPGLGLFRERRDELRSPFGSWRDNQVFMPAVEVHATQMLNLLQRDWLRRMRGDLELFAVVLSAFVFGAGLMWLRPAPATAGSVGGAFCVIALAAAGFQRGVWFPWMIVAGLQVPAALVGSYLFHFADWFFTRRRLEAARREAEAKIREQAALIDKANDAILVQDMEGRVVYGNPRTEQLYGWAIADLQRNGRAQTIFQPDAEKFADARAAVARNGSWSGELRQQTRDGRQLIVESRWTLIRDEAGKPKSILLINSDVTDKKQLEAQFLRTQRMDTIGSLAGGMAHDLNNALSPVLLGVQLLQRKAAGDEEAKRILSLMEASTHRGAEMVRQVLLFARGKEGELQPLDLAGPIKDITRMARETFPKNITVESFIAQDLHRVRGNLTQLHQVLLNLCVNARDAMPNGGRLTVAADNATIEADGAPLFPHLSATASDATPEQREGPALRGGEVDVPPGEYVSIMVSDTGTGMSPEVRARIFEAFFTTKGEGKGTGLGLATVQRIVKNHAGAIRVESQPGEGTTFEILLPRVAEQPQKISPAAPGELPRGKGELILVVDDEQAILDLVSEGLSAQGYRVIAASNGAEALDTFRTQRKDIALVLTDSEMPLMNGARLVSALRNENSTIPVIMASGEAVGGSAHDSIIWLKKPFTLEEALTAIASAMAKSG